MTDKYDIEHLEAGDTFEGGPLEQNEFISHLLAAGAEFKIKGNKVEITKLEKKESKAKAASSSKKEALKSEGKATDAPKAEAKKEEAHKAEDKATDAPKAEAKKEEAPKAESDKTKE